jgi:hypothetical protein
MDAYTPTPVSQSWFPILYQFILLDELADQTDHDR